MATNVKVTPADSFPLGHAKENKDASAYTLHVQRKCQNPVGLQKPYPYAVQTGTGVLRGGINVSNVASACGTSNPVLTPPDWYTGASIIKSDGTNTTLRDQLKNRNIIRDIQSQVYLNTYYIN